MISGKMIEAINSQIDKEKYSAFLYMAMSAKAEGLGYAGVANWFMVQYHEEIFHAMKFYRYLLEQDAAPAIERIEKPQLKGEGVLSMFEQALEHEKTVTAAIHNLAALAEAENDHASGNLFQ